MKNAISSLRNIDDLFLIIDPERIVEFSVIFQYISTKNPYFSLDFSFSSIENSSDNLFSVIDPQFVSCYYFFHPHPIFITAHVRSSLHIVCITAR